jgi:hypothetical protein
VDNLTDATKINVRFSGPFAHLLGVRKLNAHERA